MKIRHATLLAVPLLGTAAYLAYLCMHPAEVVTQGANIVTVIPSQRALNVERGTATNVVDLSAQQGDIASFRVEISSLRAEVLALRNQISRQNASSPAAGDAQTMAETRSDSAARAMERQAEIDLADAKFRQQAIDPTWSANTVSAIRGVLKSDEIGGIQADNIDCRSSSCRIELHDDGSGRLNKSLPILAQQLGGTMPSLVANNIPQGNNSSTMVLYFSRDGDDE